jgi:predicted XRE-type DNA-binding protein
MKKSFLRLVLDHQKIKQIRAAELLGWSPQRVSYLCSEDAEGFPFNELVNLKEKLGISSKVMLKILKEFLFENK